ETAQACVNACLHQQFPLWGGFANRVAETNRVPHLACSSRMQEWRYVESAEMVNQHDGLFPLIDLKEDERLAVRCEGGLGYTLSERHEETCFPGVELIEEKRAFSGAVIDNKIDYH